MDTYHLDNDNRFIIEDYQNQRPFSSTLPGIAGPMGIPMWVFYVNRGQAITSFGVENKDHPIMEFQPANKAYQLTPYLGFRTFIKITSADEPAIIEPFAAGSQNRQQQIIVSYNELGLSELFPAPGLRVEIIYFTLPEEKLAGLVRQVKITNLAEKTVGFEILDGLPAIIPYGVSNQDLKEYNRTIEAWMEVYNQENGIPIYRLRSTPKDVAEIRSIRAGNFALAYAEQAGLNHSLTAIVDPEIIFRQDTSLVFPVNFHEDTLDNLLQRPQIACGKTPCAIFGHSTSLEPGESVTLHSVYGHSSRPDFVNEVSPRMSSPDYFEQKRRTAGTLADKLTAPIATKTSSPVFDAYCRQTFLDNVLRGGWPVHLGNDEKPVTYHIYSRKHGDPERDYNAFFLAAEHYSQGNGNYRDINQNRRSEIFFDPRVNDVNIRSFMSLIQADGYNPLVVKGSRFWISPEKRKFVSGLVVQSDQIASLLEKSFTPGGLLKWIDDKEIVLQIPTIDFLVQMLQTAEQYYEAEFGEGYWSDHWTYNLDLIENYLSVYPDKRKEFLFERHNLPFFDTAAFVKPRSQKYVLAGNQPRQYDAVVWDAEKAALIAARQDYPNYMRTQNGQGAIYLTSLFAKLFILALLKFTTMDPYGMGIEMEAGKPSWCDALNGLPGLFGSSMSETFELARLLAFIKTQLSDNIDDFLTLPIEVGELYENTTNVLQSYLASKNEQRDFLYWDSVATARESYRQKTRLGFEGSTIALPFSELEHHISLFMSKVQNGIDRAQRLNEGITPTYFTNELVDYDILRGLDGEPLKDSKQRLLLHANRFSQKVLPVFLEGAVHMLKTLTDTDTVRQLYRCIRHSSLYDNELKMYKTNASLESLPMEIGRLRAFTPGWLENESIFLHMEYKYLLELLRAGLYEEFFEDFRNTLVAFQDPGRYGRSPLENSSFIVSSSHPDKSQHGRGFVARLTGATAEFLSMWLLMMVGQEPFIIDHGTLCLRLQPALPGWLFDEAGQVRFSFLCNCQVTYHNPLHKNTYSKDMQIQRILLHQGDEQIEIRGNKILSPYAALVRDGQIRRIDAFFPE